jgi:hypothetical protein
VRDLLPYLTDAVSVIARLPVVEVGRRRQGPALLVARMRDLGSRSARRGPAGRARLRFTIRIVDRLMPGGPNCFRRALLETALDAGAAQEDIRCGLSAAGGAGSGHAWLPGEAPAPDVARSYDALFTL